MNKLLEHDKFFELVLNDYESLLNEFLTIVSNNEQYKYFKLVKKENDKYYCFFKNYNVTEIKENIENNYLIHIPENNQLNQKSQILIDKFNNKVSDKEKEQTAYYLYLMASSDNINKSFEVNENEFNKINTNYYFESAIKINYQKYNEIIKIDNCDNEPFSCFEYRYCKINLSETYIKQLLEHDKFIKLVFRDYKSMLLDFLDIFDCEEYQYFNLVKKENDKYYCFFKNYNITEIKENIENNYLIPMISIPKENVLKKSSTGLITLFNSLINFIKSTITVEKNRYFNCFNENLNKLIEYCDNIIETTIYDDEDKIKINLDWAEGFRNYFEPKFSSLKTQCINKNFNFERNKYIKNDRRLIKELTPKSKLGLICKNILNYGDCDRIENDQECNHYHPINFKNYLKEEKNKYVCTLVLKEEYKYDLEDEYEDEYEEYFQKTYKLCLYDEDLCPKIKFKLDNIIKEKEYYITNWGSIETRKPYNQDTYKTYEIEDYENDIYESNRDLLDNSDNYNSDSDTNNDSNSDSDSNSNSSNNLNSNSDNNSNSSNNSNSNSDNSDNNDPIIIENNSNANSDNSDTNNDSNSDSDNNSNSSNNSNSNSDNSDNNDPIIIENNSNANSDNSDTNNDSNSDSDNNSNSSNNLNSNSDNSDNNDTIIIKNNSNANSDSDTNNDSNSDSDSNSNSNNLNSNSDNSDNNDTIIIKNNSNANSDSDTNNNLNSNSDNNSNSSNNSNSNSDNSDNNDPIIIENNSNANSDSDTNNDSNCDSDSNSNSNDLNSNSDNSDNNDSIIIENNSDNSNNSNLNSNSLSRRIKSLNIKLKSLKLNLKEIKLDLEKLELHLENLDLEA